MTFIDHGHYEVSDRDAKRLAGGRLPAPGKEMLVADENGRHWWLGRARLQGRAVWSIRDAGRWRLVDGVATLCGWPA